MLKKKITEKKFPKLKVGDEIIVSIPFKVEWVPSARKGHMHLRFDGTKISLGEGENHQVLGTIEPDVATGCPIVTVYPEGVEKGKTFSFYAGPKIIWDEVTNLLEKNYGIKIHG